MKTDYDAYEGRLVCFDDGNGSFACFVPRCPECGRFVKVGHLLMNRDGDFDHQKPNATCKKHGEVIMPFDGYHSEEDLESH